jgi:AhpD family alkylhydroperoxidase
LTATPQSIKKEDSGERLVCKKEKNMASRLKKLDKGQGTPQANDLMSTLDGNKKLFNIFRSMANSAAVLDSYLKFSGAMNNAKLDVKQREAIALAVSQDNRCEYCLSAHTAIGKGAGLDEPAIKDARQGRSKDRKTQGAVTLARAIVEKRGNVNDADVKAARESGLDDGELAEVVATVTQTIFTNYFNHMNQTEVDFPKVAVNE